MKQNTTQNGTDSTISTQLENRLPEKVEQRFQNLKEESYVSKTNAEAIEEFLYELNVVRDDQLSDHRQRKYLSQFSMILQYVDFPLLEATVEEFRPLLNAIDSEDVSPSTKRDRRVALSKFYRTMFPDEGNRPTRIHRILHSQITDLTHPDESDRVRQYDFIWPEEVMEMIGAAQNNRDALLVLFTYTTGARLESIRKLQKKEVTVHSDHIEFDLANHKNKKLPENRTVYLKKCYHLARKWIEEHPSEDPESHFFCRLAKSGSREEAGSQLTKRSIPRILERLAERVELDKRHNPHAFRYSMATYLKKIEGWDLDMVANRGGWGSIKTVRGYILDEDEIVGNDRKQKLGIETDYSFDKNPLAMITCHDCETEQSPTRERCISCGSSLREVEVAMDTEKEAVLIEEDQQGLAQAL